MTEDGWETDLIMIISIIDTDLKNHICEQLGYRKIH